MNKKLWGLIIPLLCVVQAAGAAVYSGTCGANVSWSLNTNDGILQITGSGRMYDYTYDTRAPWHPYNSSIRRVVIDNNVTRIGNYAFNGYSTIDSVAFGGVRTIGQNGLNRCGGLRTAIISQLDTLEEYSMNYNGNLTKFVAGNQLKKICNSALEGCGNLQMAYFGDNVERLEAYSLMYCYSLDSVYLGQRLQRIDEYVFHSSRSLRRIAFPSTLEHIGYCAFDGSGLQAIHIPVSTNDISDEAFTNCGDVLQITVDPANQTYDSRNNCNAIIRKGDLCLIRGCQNTAIPTSITRIGGFAFSGCYGLTQVVIPQNITSMGYRAFDNCGLTSANFPNSITDCGEAPFNGCHGLTTPLYNNTYFVFLPYDFQGAYTFPQGPTKIVASCCSDRDQLTAAYIPDGYTEIGNNAFAYCDALDTASIGEGPQCVPGYMFIECASLRGVHLPNSLTYIDYYAFHNCRSLLRITIPDGVYGIGPEAFVGCSSLQYVSIPAALQRFESWGGSTFDGCTSLSHVYWNARTLQDPEEARRAPFYGIRSQIQQFDLGDSVRYVPNYLCYEMSSLQSIKIGANVTKIGTMTDLESTGNVFYNCSSVSSIEWNARNVENPLMYDYAPFYTFRENVTSFTIGDSVRVLPNYLCFGMNHLTNLRIPKNVFYIGEFTFRLANGLNSITVDAGNQYYDSRNNCNAIIEKETNTLLLGCKRTVIPTTVTSIGDCAFRNCVGLTSITIPNSVSSIKREAFNGCTALTSISLPQGISEVADYTFQDCSALQSVTLPSGLKRVGIRAFSNCSSLPTVSMPATTTSIDEEAFDKTQMTSMVMLGTTPPQITYSSLPEACPITIPCAAIEAYQNAPVWGDLGTRLSAQYPHSITVSANNALWGTTSVSRTDCSEVVLTATASNGFHFVEWQDTNGQRLSDANPYTLNLTGNTALIGFFQAGAAPSAARITVSDREVSVETNEPTLWRLVDLQGHPVDYAEGESIRLTAPASGIYILHSANETHKIMIR